MLEVNSMSLQGVTVAEKPFPLGPRDPNACPRFSKYMASAYKASHKNPACSKKRTYNPMYQRRPAEERERKQTVYLKKVKDDGDDRRWESRSEQVWLRITLKGMATFFIDAFLVRF